MDSILIYQAANDLVQNTGTRNIKRIARSCSLDILETPRFKDVLGFLSLHYDKPLILINSHLDSQTKQMVCGYALGHYLEHQILMDLHTLNKSLAITDKEICLYEPNAFASHLMLDSEEVYQMTKRKMDAAQIADAKRIQNIPFKCPHKLILLFLIFSTITIEKSQMHSSEFGGYTSSSRVF